MLVLNKYKRISVKSLIISHQREQNHLEINDGTLDPNQAKGNPPRLKYKYFSWKWTLTCVSLTNICVIGRWAGTNQRVVRLSDKPLINYKLSLRLKLEDLCAPLIKWNNIMSMFSTALHLDLNRYILATWRPLTADRVDSRACDVQGVSQSCIERRIKRRDSQIVGYKFEMTEMWEVWHTLRQEMGKCIS